VEIGEARPGPCRGGGPGAKQGRHLFAETRWNDEEEVSNLEIACVAPENDARSVLSASHTKMHGGVGGWGVAKSVDAKHYIAA
jgi:hypothetical protein